MKVVLRGARCCTVRQRRKTPVGAHHLVLCQSCGGRLRRQPGQLGLEACSWGAARAQLGAWEGVQGSGSALPGATERSCTLCMRGWQPCRVLASCQTSQAPPGAQSLWPGSSESPPAIILLSSLPHRLPLQVSELPQGPPGGRHRGSVPGGMPRHRATSHSGGAVQPPPKRIGWACGAVDGRHLLSLRWPACVGRFLLQGAIVPQARTVMSSPSVAVPQALVLSKPQPL